MKISQENLKKQHVLLLFSHKHVHILLLFVSEVINFLSCVSTLVRRYVPTIRKIHKYVGIDVEERTEHEDERFILNYGLKNNKSRYKIKRY